jgi:thioredoxin reductase
MTQEIVDVAIIGAGPYGLSIAAHLRAHKISFRIFGTPMSSWRNHMAAGTLLKSFGFASSLYDPGSTFTLEHYCQEQGIPYSDSTDPVSLETFIAYGMEFQRRLVPELEQTDITSVKQSSNGFVLTTQTGEVLSARRVVVAVGITNFGNIPPIFAGLPEELLTHSSQHTEVSQFSGRSVAVIGAGASAADLAGLLHEAGAETHMITRRAELHFHDPPFAGKRPLSHRLLMPRSGLGNGWKPLLCSDFPLAYHALPTKFRVRALKRVNGPAGGWFAKSKVVGCVNLHLGTRLKEVSKNGSGVRLLFTQRDGTDKELKVDHVIAATGYKPRLERITFLDEDLRKQMKTEDEASAVDTNFESSVPGLYLVGLAAAISFGPMCRFAYGAKFTSDRITRHLASTAR